MIHSAGLWWLLLVMLQVAASPAMHAEDRAANTVRVMTFNIRYLNPGDGPDHWRHRVGTVAEVIEQADIVGLQEATRRQIDDLLPQLDTFDWYGVGRDDGKDCGEFSPIFWRRDRFRAIDRGTFWLGPDPQAVGQPAWAARIPRICSWVVLETAKGTPGSIGGEVLVMNTHFDHQSEQARINSAELLRRKARELAGDRHVIVMGDFNGLPESRPIKALTAPDRGEWPLVDTMARSETPPQGPKGTWNAFQAIDEQTRIDFIFTRPDRVRVVAHQTTDPKTPAGRFASDHLPVTVKLAF